MARSSSTIIAAAGGKTLGLEFTRGRPYRKNDNAYIEQKNWTHVRKIFGWKRIDAPAAIEVMNALYRGAWSIPWHVHGLWEMEIQRWIFFQPFFVPRVTYN